MNEYQENLLRNLTRKFPQSVVRTLDTPYMKGQKHVPHQYITDRLNEVLGANWEFIILREQIEKRNGAKGEAIVLGDLVLHIPINDKPNTPCITIHRHQFGKKELVCNEGEDKSWTPTQIGDDLKAAASNALVKCASLYGMGSELYFEEDEQERQEKILKMILEEIGFICRNVLNVKRVELVDFAKTVLKIDAPQESIDIETLELWQYMVLCANLLKAVEKNKNNKENE